MMDLDDLPPRPKIVDVDVIRSYSPQQEASRRELIELIEVEKRAFYERVEPYLKKLEAIESTAQVSYVVCTSPR